MPLETTTTLDGLNSAWPDIDDEMIEGDDHIRLLKSVLKTQFPGAAGNGFVGSILTYVSELNHLSGLVSNLQQQIDSIDANNIQIGAVIMYSGTTANIPANYSIANGTNGTINLSQKFIRGTNSSANNGITGGSDTTITIDHTHTFDHNHVGTMASDPGHTHDMLRDSEIGSTGGDKFLGISNSGTPNGAGDFLVSGTFSLDETHSHVMGLDSSVKFTDVAGNDAADSNLPPFYTLLFIQRMS